jgi:hypothetical protein
MRNWLNNYYNILEIDSSYTFENVKKNYKELSFIWHPDRHPDKYKKRAENKIQELNEAFDYFDNNREYLNNTEGKWEPDFGYEENNSYHSNIIECLRCNASGYIANSVQGSQKFQHIDCPVCSGNAYIIADERNGCQQCDGKGLNPNVSSEDRDGYIENELEKLNLIEKIHSKLHYKKLWLKFFNEKMLCQSCSGSGYFYYRHNKRKDGIDRRLSSEADFLFFIENSEKRKNERRKPIESV